MKMSRGMTIALHKNRDVWVGLSEGEGRKSGDDDWGGGYSYMIALGAVPERCSAQQCYLVLDCSDPTKSGMRLHVVSHVYSSSQDASQLPGQSKTHSFMWARA